MMIEDLIAAKVVARVDANCTRVTQTLISRIPRSNCGEAGCHLDRRS